MYSSVADFCILGGIMLLNEVFGDDKSAFVFLRYGGDKFVFLIALCHAGL